MAVEPKYLFLDEPAAGLHRDEQELPLEGIRNVTSRNVGVLLVEHNFPLVQSVSDRITVLQRGQVLLEGTADEVASDPRLVDTYLGEDPSAAATTGAQA